MQALNSLFISTFSIMQKYLHSLIFTFILIYAHGQSTQDSLAIVKLLEKEAAIEYPSFHPN
jgi:hypothetical protein